MNTNFFDFEIEREFKCTPSVLFRAWADPAIKAKWFHGPGAWVETGRALDLREGGVETMTGDFPGRFTTSYTAHFYDVQQDSRIGYSFEVRLGGEIYSISTVVVEFHKSKYGTTMQYHEQIAVFNQAATSEHTFNLQETRANRIMGTQGHFDSLTGYLETCKETH